MTTTQGEHVDPAERSAAIAQIKRRRRFRTELVGSVIGMVALTLIWAFTEYHNAGGWPTAGFSQSSGIHDVWNYWIIYPWLAWVLIVGVRAWRVYRSDRPITEHEIEREVARRGRR